MTNDIDTSARMRQFEEYLSAGYEHWKWHYLWTTDEKGTPSEREAVLFFMDAEYDLVRVTYDDDGVINIHADGAEWCSLTADSLTQLSTMTDEIENEVDKWRDGLPSDATEGWGEYEDSDDA